MKFSMSSCRKRTLARGWLLRDFRARGRSTYREAPENAGDGRFEGVSPGIGGHPISPGQLEPFPVPGPGHFPKQMFISKQKLQEDGEANPPRVPMG